MTKSARQAETDQGHEMNGTAEPNMNEIDYTAEQTHSDPLLRPFEVIAIACGVTTLIATFLVSVPLLKGLLISGSLLALIGTLLYYGVVGTRDKVRRVRTAIPRSAIKSMGLTT